MVAHANVLLDVVGSHHVQVPCTAFGPAVTRAHCRPWHISSDTADRADQRCINHGLSSECFYVSTIAKATMGPAMRHLVQRRYVQYTSALAELGTES